MIHNGCNRLRDHQRFQGRATWKCLGDYIICTLVQMRERCYDWGHISFITSQFSSYVNLHAKKWLFPISPVSIQYSCFLLHILVLIVYILSSHKWSFPISPNLIQTSPQQWLLHTVFMPSCLSSSFYHLRSLPLSILLTLLSQSLHSLHWFLISLMSFHIHFQLLLVIALRDMSLILSSSYTPRLMGIQSSNDFLMFLMHCVLKRAHRTTPMFIVVQYHPMLFVVHVFLL